MQAVVSALLSSHASANVLIDKISKAQVLSQFSTTFSNVVYLKLKAVPKGLQLDGTEDVESMHLPHQFAAAQTLHASREIAGHIALALEDII